MSLFSSFEASGQGTFFLQNYSPSDGVNAPVFDAQSVPLAGSDYLAELWGGPTPDSLAPAVSFGSRVMAPFLTGRGAGYFQHMSVVDVEIPSVPGGAWAWLQVRAWDARLGATYEAVVASGLGGYGESNFLQLIAGGAGVPPSLPAPLIGLQSFSLREIVPEPSAAWLLLLGLPLLLGRGRGGRWLCLR